MTHMAASPAIQQAAREQADIGRRIADLAERARCMAELPEVNQTQAVHVKDLAVMLRDVAIEKLVRGK